MKTHAIFFPFDLFDGGGARIGVELLADAIKEMLADNRRERLPTRARAYTNRVRCEEFLFNALPDYQDWRAQARQAADKVLRRGDRLLWVAGSHLGVLPVYEALGAMPGPSVVVQLDAHLDIYHLSDCKAELSHGNFLLHADGPLPRLLNLGHRDLLFTPAHIGKYYQQTFSAAELAVDPQPAWNAVQAACRAADRVFFDVDCDVFDPAFFPAVAHPLPFGMSPTMLLRCLEAGWSGKVVGIAVSEFDPGRDVRDQSLALLLWLIEYVLLKTYET